MAAGDRGACCLQGCGMDSVQIGSAKVDLGEGRRAAVGDPTLERAPDVDWLLWQLLRPTATRKLFDSPSISSVGLAGWVASRGSRGRTGLSAEAGCPALSHK